LTEQEQAEYIVRYFVKHPPPKITFKDPWFD
jgi:hypothetical protein